MIAVSNGRVRSFGTFSVTSPTFGVGTRLSPSTVSELNQKIYAQIERWRNRAIEGNHPARSRRLLAEA